MDVNPTEIQLSPVQQAFIARESERRGRPWPELLAEFIPASQARNGDNGETAFDAADRLGLVGGVHSGERDLATHPRHLEGFGE